MVADQASSARIPETTEKRTSTPTHAYELKCWPAYFAAILDGRKTFEFRFNDRGFSEGDTILLREYDPNRELRHDHSGAGPHTHPGDYTGRSLTARIGYVLTSGFGLPAGHAVFSLLGVEEVVDA